MTDEVGELKVLARFFFARWVWRAALLAAIAAAVLGVATSQGWQRPPSSYNPYLRPAIASTLPDAESLRAMTRQELIPISTGPPMDRGFISLVPAAEDFRRITLVGAWEQTWVSPDELTVLTIRVVELRRREYVPLFEAECRTTAPLSVAPPVLVAGPEAGDGAPSFCALAQAGRALVTVRVTSTSTDQTGAVVQAIAQTLSSRIPPESDLPPGDRRFTTARGAMLRSWVIAVLLLAIVSTVPTLLCDRATRERLLAFRRRSRPNPHHIDIELPAGFQILRERTMGFARLALLIWAVRLGEMTYQGIFATWALVGCAYVSSLLAERFVLRRSSHRRIPRHFRGRSLGVVIVGTVLSLGILIAAGFVWTLGNTLGALGVPQSPDWATGSSSLLFQLTALVMVAYSVLPLSIARRIGMRLLRNPRFADDVRPVLFLRSFTDDGIEMRVRRLDRASIIDRVAFQRIARFEQVAVVALSRLGPVVAVATPGERMPPGLGAVRQQFSHEEWQHGVSDLATQASLIVITAGRSEGLVWEMRRLKESGSLQKAIFLIPPVSPKERLRRLAVLAESLHLPTEFLTVAAGRTVLAVCVPDGPENPMVIASAAPDDTSYDLALGLCAQKLLGETLDRELILLSKSGGEWHIPDPIPLPPANVIPAGKAVARKPLRRRVLTWVLVANIAVVPVAKALLTGNAGDSSDLIILGSNVRVHEFLGQSGPNVFVLFNQGEVGSVNFDTRSGSYVGRLPGGAATAVLRNDHIYYLSGTGVARAWNLRSRRVVWTTRIGRGARSIAVIADRVLVADPVHSSVDALDPDTGRRITSVQIPGRPWDIVAHGDNAAVALPDRGQVIVLSLPNLSTGAPISGAEAPYQLHAWNGRILVTDSMGWRIHTLGSDEFVVARSNRYGEVAASGDVLAVEGVDMISVFSPKGIVRYNTSRVTTALGVLDDGSVLRATGNGVWRFTDR